MLCIQPWRNTSECACHGSKEGGQVGQAQGRQVGEAPCLERPPLPPPCPRNSWRVKLLLATQVGGRVVLGDQTLRPCPPCFVPGGLAPLGLEGCPGGRGFWGPHSPPTRIEEQRSWFRLDREWRRIQWASYQFFCPKPRPDPEG